MRKRGFRHTKTLGEGHQHCGICHPTLKNGAGRARFEDKSIVTREDWVCPAGTVACPGTKSGRKKLHDDYWTCGFCGHECESPALEKFRALGPFPVSMLVCATSLGPYVDADGQRDARPSDLDLKPEASDRPVLLDASSDHGRDGGLALEEHLRSGE